MAPKYDLVIRNGIVIDGLGGAERETDIAVTGDRIRVIGKVTDSGREEIDAKGKIVTPGFVDIHTHYDGQVFWDDRLAPSSQHGVTTVVMGNCGVGFAPCPPELRAALVSLMEGVEDIPEAVMAAGLPWNWETFPQYLNALDSRSMDIDFAAQLPHSPLRVYVMGQRGIDREPATANDLARMRALTAEALSAGAIGVSTSRILNHRTVDGTLAPHIGVDMSEFLALAQGMKDAGAGVFEIAPSADEDPDVELEVVRQVARVSGRPASMACVENPAKPHAWEQTLRGLEKAAEEGLEIRAQIFPRPAGLIQGLNLTLHGFVFHPSFKAIADLPLAGKVAKMRDPDFRRKILSETPIHTNPVLLHYVNRTSITHRLGNPPNYEPKPETSLSAEAERRGIDPLDYYYDVLLEEDGRILLYTPIVNFHNNSIAATRRMFEHPNTLVSLGDGGAHLGMICDASIQTYMLTRWLAGVGKTDGFDLPWLVQRITQSTANAVRLHDRGVLASGYKADINVIDLGRLHLHPPHMVQDLPQNGKRLMQRADGYTATIVSGQIVYRDGQDMGVRPGHLIRPGRLAQATH